MKKIIIELVMLYCDVDPSELRRRTASVVKYKRLAIAILYTHMGMSNKEVAEFMKVDHSTVIHHLNIHASDMKIYEQYRKDYLALVQIVDENRHELMRQKIQKQKAA